MAIKRTFGSLTKVDEANRRVTGVLAQEVVDHSGEILDYDTSKAEFAQWSAELEKNSGGKNLGNVRVMHGSTVAGRLVQFWFDDVTKAVMGTAEIDDDNEWNKVLKGAYTGFSIGGKYLKKWADQAARGVMRYTARPFEVSIVDNPCIPTATFQIAKADGTIETMEFHGWEPLDDEIAARAKDIAKATGHEIAAARFMARAREELLAEYEAELLKSVDVEDDEVVAEAEVEKTEAAVDPLAVLSDALAKADEALKAAQEPAEEEVVEKTIDPNSADALAKTLAGFEGYALEKGLYSVSSLARALERLAEIQVFTASEAKAEGDNSPVPGQILAALTTLGDALVAMAREEMSELLASLSPGQVDPMTVYISDCDYVSCAAAVVDMVKADEALSATAAERAAKRAPEAAEPEDDVEKAALVADKDRLEKAVLETAPHVEMLAKALTDMRSAHAAELLKRDTDLADLTKRLEAVENEPVRKTAAGNVAVSKEQDGNSNADDDINKGATDIVDALSKMTPHQQNLALIKASLRNPMQIAG